VSLFKNNSLDPTRYLGLKFNLLGLNYLFYQHFCLAGFVLEDIGCVVVLIEF